MQYLILIAALIGFGGGFFVASQIGDANLKQCELDTEKMLKTHEAETAERMRVAQSAVSRALSHLAGSLIETQQQAEDLTNELKKHTTGRDCLSAGARRLLQPAASQKQRMREDTGSADTTTAGSAGNTGDGNETTASTDADIAGWIVEASKLYEQCRDRIEAIGQWDAELNGRN